MVHTHISLEMWILMYLLLQSSFFIGYMSFNPKHEMVKLKAAIIHDMSKTPYMSRVSRFITMK